MKKGFQVLIAIAAASVAALVSAAPPMTSGRSLAGHEQKTDWVAPQATASGLGVNLALVGYLVGANNTLYKTAVDVTNNMAAATQVDFFFDGVSGANTYSINGSISSTGALVAQGTGGSVPAHYNAHFDDFISSIVAVPSLALPSSVLPAGITGSVLIVFNTGNAPKSGQGWAAARFYNNPGSTDTTYNHGTVGVAARGHEITTLEPTKVIATCRKTVGEANTPQLLTHLMINNTGITPTNSGAASAVSIALTAVDSKTGAAVGTPLSFTLGPGLTQQIDPFGALAVTSTDSILVTVTATPSGGSGAAIEVLTDYIDNTTRDGTIAEAARADF